MTQVVRLVERPTNIMQVHFIKTVDIKEKIDTLFNSEKKKLQDIFPSSNIEHIGGTSVPSLISKGDLDINIRVPEKDFQRSVETLKGLYEINQPNNWTSGFASFKDDSRDIGVQLTVKDSADDLFVPQREFLKNHPEKVLELNILKEKFEGGDMDEYRVEKGKFFESLNI